MQNIRIEDIPEFDTRIKNIFRRREIIYLKEIEEKNIDLNRITGLGKKSCKIIYKAIYKYIYKKEEIIIK